MSVKAVIFDLDGTLLYTLEDLTDSVNYVMEKYGFETYSVSQVRDAVGNGLRLLLERILPKTVDKAVFEQCLKDFKAHYSKNMYNKTKPYEGILEVLEKLKKSGYKLAVLSNKYDSAVKELSKKYFGQLIDCAVGQKDGIKEKPDSAGVLEIVKELGVELSQCVFVGDSEVDILTAANCSIDCISVVWGYKDIDFLYDNGASKLVYTPEDILELL